ncbi:hypothetical protein [Carboxylicivirga sp. M1479]|uniref:hypothetical protein n=1 Tax=Carboxylicivirga sp. M1479 TaxID=2594476 RepID=UPI001178C3BA|nr:hypothetical protein [Carboxylicivirga sp. M1479]TRX71313.1 hypothetical protein FNN09_06895 [Carboxylicivirga sp. M1479]
MKKLLFIACFIASATFMSAQDSKFMAGAGLTYATDIDNIGINVKGLYLINETWEADAGFTYFFEKNNVNYSALDFNGHYVFLNNEGKCLYGLAGINITFYKIEIDGIGTSDYDEYDDYYGGSSEYEDFYGENPFSSLADAMESKGSEFGFNLGFGGRLPLTEALNLTGEIKYILGGANYFSIGAGILYHF